jgi:hypothetical protein
MSRGTSPTRPPRERVIVTGVRFTDFEGAPPEEDLSEACGLVAAAEADVVGDLSSRRSRAPTRRRCSAAAR